MWPGELRRVRVELAPPKHFIRPESCLTAIAPWVLPDLDRETVAQLLREHLIPLDLQRAILQETECTPGQGCVVRPTADIVFALEPLTRRGLYRLLGSFFGNETKLTPYRFIESDLSSPAGQDGLSPSALDLLRRLTVNEGGYALFWDFGALCQRMNDEDKVRFIRAVTRSESYLVKLVLRSDTEVEPIYRYWSGRPRQKSLLTLLLSARPTGESSVSVDIAHLLSPFLRALIYNYPLPGDPPYDCHWTTLNFFEDRPDNRFLDPRVVRETFLQWFEPIRRESARYGDVVAMVDEHQRVNHTAIYLAEDLVFSKNGNSLYSPWVVTTIDSLLRLYQYTPGSHLEFYRRREGGP